MCISHFFFRVNPAPAEAAATAATTGKKAERAADCEWMVSKVPYYAARGRLMAQSDSPVRRIILSADGHPRKKEHVVTRHHNHNSCQL